MDSPGQEPGVVKSYSQIEFMDLNYDLIFVPTCKRCQVSAPPPTKKRSV